LKIKSIKILTVFFLILSGCTIRLIPSRPTSYSKNGEYHRVKKGENLYRISQHYGISVEAIKRANHLRSDRVYVGQRLSIPQGVKAERIPVDKIKKEYSIVKLEKGEFLWPAKGKVVRKFGEENDGIDILLAPKAKVVASKKGKVSFCDATKGYGMTIIIDHQNGYYSVYAQEIVPSVKKGEIVSQGAEIARMKDQEKEPLLHFEIRRGVEPVDPLFYLGD